MSNQREHKTGFGRVLLVILTWMLVGWSIFGGLMAPVLPGGWTTILVLAALTLLSFLVLIRNVRTGGYPSVFTRIWIYRPFWYSQLLMLALAAAGLVGVIGGLPFGEAGPAGRWAIVSMAAILFTLALIGYAGTRRLVVRAVEVAFDRLPEALEGLRIVQLSDLHIGPHTPRRHLDRILDAVRRATPDLIAITGDQVDDYARDVDVFARAFRELFAPLGVYAIPGNHDIYAGWDQVSQGLQAMGIRVLVNEALPLAHNGTRFWLGGTGDPAGLYWPRNGGAAAAPDLDRTMQAVPPGAFSIVLAHNPALWPELARKGADLTLSGHTHHGQFSIPQFGWSLASIFLEHAMGMHRNGHSVLYINPGTNYWGIPFRIGALPELTVFTLRGKNRDSSIV